MPESCEGVVKHVVATHYLLRVTYYLLPTTYYRQARHIYNVSGRDIRFFRRKVNELCAFLEGHTSCIYCEHGAHRSEFAIMTVLIMAGCRSSSDTNKTFTEVLCLAQQQKRICIEN